MKIRKAVSYSLGLILSTGLLVGCGNNDTELSQEGSVDKEDATTVTFWAAPNPTQETFWKQQADKFMEENDNIVVEVTQMQETPSSEATIQSAVAAGNAPTMSENITRSFGAQLSESEVIIPLNEYELFDEIIDNRSMENTIKTWEFADGTHYIFPVYSNPILFGWRTDLLEEYGIDDIPETYSELLTIATDIEDEDLYIWAKEDLNDPTAWMRNFDFFPMYNAASDGNAFIEGNDLVADDEAGIKLLELMYELQEKNGILTSGGSTPFEDGLSIMADLGPWAFPNWEEQYPELEYGKNFEVTPPVVPDSLGTNVNAPTFADAKGVVIYEQATEEERLAGLEFLKYVFSDIENDLSFLEITSLIPARDDAADSEVFNFFFEQNPVMKVYAENVQNSVPPMDNSNFNNLQGIIGEEAWNPVVSGTKTAQEAWNDMITALQGELK